MHVAVAHPTMRTAFLPALSINIFVTSSRNKGPKEALGPCLSELQLFPGWLLFLVGQDGQFHGKAAARLPRNRIIPLEGQCYTKARLPCLWE